VASLTPRLKLSYFGSGVAGSLQDDSGKYTSLDRIVLDRAISTLEANDYHYRSRTVTQAATPAVVLGSAGTLTGSTTYNYCVAFMDASGGETLASNSVSVLTPGPFQAPGQPSASLISGGMLTPKTWYYAVTTVNTGATKESKLSPVIGVTSSAGSATVKLVTPAVVDGEFIRVWRVGEDALYWTLIGSCEPGQEFTDTGAIPPDPCAGCDVASQPPQVARGSYVSSVTVTINDADLDKLASGYVGWRLYRTAGDATYTSQSLIATVTDHTTAGNASTPLVKSFTDSGLSASVGQPSTTAGLITPKPFVFDGDESRTSLPTPSNYPDKYPLYVDGQLYMARTPADPLLPAYWERIGGNAFTFGPANQPATTVHRDGDVHLNSDTFEIYQYVAATQIWELRLTIPKARTALLSGMGAPVAATGLDGDFYLDTGAAPVALYGPKASGVWPSSPTQLGGGGGTGSAVLTSPSGNRFRLVVADDGTLSTEATLEPGPPAAPSNLQED
jgi:hypothetical protein